MSAQDNVTLARTLIESYNTQDIEQYAAVATEDCEVLDVPSGMVSHGREALKQFAQVFITAFPDGKLELTNIFATDDQAAFEFVARGTHTGPLVSPSGQIPPTGRDVELRFCNIVQVRNGKVASQHTYYDALGLLQQLGLIPPQG